jgi:hypothetical protein
MLVALSEWASQVGQKGFEVFGLGTTLEMSWVIIPAEMVLKS